LSRRPRFLTDADWRYGERVTAFAKHVLARGIQLAYHHHMGAYVETAEDVDRFMGLTGPEVGLLHDTGHVTFAGGDAPTELRKHVGRVVHVHCKDVRPAVARMARNGGWSFLESVLNGAFSTPGEGCVDFAAVIAILRDAGYRGWLVVEGEQDPAVAPAYRYADMAYRLLSSLVAGKSDAEARAQRPARGPGMTPSSWSKARAPGWCARHARASRAGATLASTRWLAPGGRCDGTAGASSAASYPVWRGGGDLGGPTSAGAPAVRDDPHAVIFHRARHAHSGSKPRLRCARPRRRRALRRGTSSRRRSAGPCADPARIPVTFATSCRRTSPPRRCSWSR
jgi:hypothetical protein